MGKVIERRPPSGLRMTFGIRIRSEEEISRLGTDAIEILLDKLMEKLPLLQKQIEAQDRTVEQMSRLCNPTNTVSSRYVEAISQLRQLMSEREALQDFHSRLCSRLKELRKENQQVA